MKFKPFWKTLDSDARQSLADRCETSVGHLNNVAGGTRSCSIKLAVSLERWSNGVVTCEEECPDFDWAYLRGSKSSPSRSTTRKAG